MVDVQDVIQLLSILADESNLRTTAKESLKGGLIAGVATMVGGLLGGRNGLILGALGGGLAAYAATDNFRGVGSILLEMDEINKQKLFEKVTEIFEKASLDDVKSLHTAAQDPEIRGKLLKAIIDHVENQLQINIVD